MNLLGMIACAGKPSRTFHYMMEHDAVLNVDWSWSVSYGARAKYKTRRYTWTPLRFSSLFWSSFCCLVAAGTAADAGTKKRLIASYLGAEEEICFRSKSYLGISGN